MSFQKIIISLGAILVITLFSIPTWAEESAWSIHGQFTFVDQWHPAFKAPYSGAYSLTPTSNSAETMDATLYIGRRLWQGAELYLNPEIDQGYGLDGTVGLAGFSSGEAYKVGNEHPYYRLPRAFIRQSFNLGGNAIELPDAPNQMAKTVTANNVIVTAGKFSVVDIFDTNTYAHDPRTDFMNWTSVESGAFDYAADAWGFTDGAAVEWTQDWWTLRSGFFVLSTVPNSQNIDTSFKQYELTEEFEERHHFFGHPGKFKILGFINKGEMGNYSDAVSLYSRHHSQLPEPDTSLVRKFASRSGVAVNFEQEVTSSLGVFAKASENDGSKETFEFTDVNRSVSAGAAFKGDAWHRPQDMVGVAHIVNGISNDAQKYFGLGGLGVLVGDGKLHYGAEQITELYYNWQAMPQVAVTFNYQHVTNPAYNQDRGPVGIVGLRVHVDF